MIWYGKDQEREMRTVFAREKGLSLQHLREDTACRPDVDGNVVLLPGEHDLGSAVVAGRNVAGHLGVLYTREAKVANLEVRCELAARRPHPRGEDKKDPP